ncbi:hypothetical protein IDH41_04060 [Paenibacillus sp. IB182493]|uniref:Phage portal protein n=2 Tax=Paenibacillus arenilitoris TaxID=2772299 RepID=A0A927CK94_9BACL|nr:hypothetical protein [Paenibacillus arenilitoris]
MKRLGVDFQIQALDGKTINRIQEQCTHYTGKGSKREKVLDEEQFGALVIQRACLIPDWSARELIEKYGTPTEAILGLLLAGEIAKLSSEILEISGFDSDEDEIKN